MRHLWIILFVSVLLGCVVCPPVDGKKKVADEENKSGNEVDDYGLEYGRYLQQVVQLLEEDKDFAKKLENISAEQIRSGHIAKELEFVKHNIRTKLDELKRIEVDRLRKLVQEQVERTELGLYRDEDGRLLESPDGRRWRTIPGHQGGAEGGVGGGGDFWLGIDRKGLKLPQHVDLRNPHSFEVDDLKKLIQTATKDLEELDRQRREEFKKYEMEKELSYRESLKNMTEEQRTEAEKHHKEMIEKHKDHPKVHHPGSKPQLEEVWEEKDHMPKEEFNPRTFFAMHDLNGDGHLDEKEVEAILIPEVKKMYDPKNEEDDPAEMEEEYHRMREHIFNETDQDKDGLISLEEFIKMTQQQEFQQDDGWKGLDEQTVYSEAELEEYMRQRQMQMGMQYQPYYGDPRMYYDVPNAQGMPPQMNYQVPPQQLHPGMPPQQQQQQQQQQQHDGKKATTSAVSLPRRLDHRDSGKSASRRIELEEDKYQSVGGMGSGGSARRYVDEYEEGKAELGRYPKMQLKNMIKEKLARDSIRLSAPPYSNPDGSRGHLETLATRYADELRTHYRDVLARLEELRKRRVAIDFPPLPPQGDSLSLKTTRNYKPGKYSPSSCLSDHEEESIYSLYEGPSSVDDTHVAWPASDPNRRSQQRCLSPRSRYFYEPCPFPAGDARDNADISTAEQNKKRGPLGRLFRSLGPKKDREKISPRHKCAKPQHQQQLNVKYLAEGSRLQIGDVVSSPGSDDEQVRLLLQLVRDGFLSMEDAMQRVQPKDSEKPKGLKTHEKIEECCVHVET